MFKRPRVLKIAVPAAAIVAVWLIFRLIGYLGSLHSFRLVAHYSAKDTPTIPPHESLKSMPEYQQYLTEGRPAVFTASGLFLYEKGGAPFHCLEEEAVIAKRDWAGRRLWAVTLPEGSWRGFIASPDGRYLATTVSRSATTLIEVWQDGTLAWDWPGAPFSARGGMMTNDGRLLLWDGDVLSIVEEGEVIATNEHLPLSVWSPSLRAEYRVSPDGSALAGVLQPRRLVPGESYFRDTGPPRFEYLALTIRNRKVVPVRKFTIPNFGGGWQFLADGSVLLGDGTVYTPDGGKGGEAGWRTLRIQEHDILLILAPYLDSLYAMMNLDLWRGDAAVQVKNAQPAPRCRIYLPQSKRTVPLDAGTIFRNTGEIQLPLLSEDGRYLLTVRPTADFPPTAVGAMARFLGKKGILPDALERKMMESIRFELFEASGKLRAVLSGRFTPDGTPYIAAARHRYIPLNAALSPAGRHLVILGQRVGSQHREYLHFAWR